MENNIIKTIKENVNIVDIIQKYSPRKIYKNGFCLCVNHSEKTPSMKIYEKTGEAHCFGGCGFHGDCIDVAQAILGYSRAETIKKICEDFNLQNTNYRLSKEEYIAKKKKEKEEELERLRTLSKQEFVLQKTEEISKKLLTLRKRCVILHSKAILTQKELEEHIESKERIKKLEDIYLTLNGLYQGEPKLAQNELIEKIKMGVIEL